jgi:CubicO group peptidase (beta-lactamase class C family)
VRNAKGDPLRTDTVMYGASLTKTVFAYHVLQLVDQGKLALDTPLLGYLDEPLPDYDPDAIYRDKIRPLSGPRRGSALAAYHRAHRAHRFGRLPQFPCDPWRYRGSV